MQIQCTIGFFLSVLLMPLSIAMVRINDPSYLQVIKLPNHLKLIFCLLNNFSHLGHFHPRSMVI
uniref:Uncharacterized protein n=1 Tax=Arundo donax TaxID=35708 RepID=A0A0A9NS13_ARUDO